MGKGCVFCGLQMPGALCRGAATMSTNSSIAFQVFPCLAAAAWEASVEAACSGMTSSLTHSEQGEGMGCGEYRGCGLDTRILAIWCKIMA